MKKMIDSKKLKEWIKDIASSYEYYEGMKVWIEDKEILQKIKELEEEG